MKWDEKGFTLTEMLLVFSIFLVISTITLILLKPQYILLERNLFFSQLKSDFYYAQQYAISHQCIVTVNIMSGRNYYYFREGTTGPVIFDRHYSNEIKVSGGSLPLYFHFRPDGNISSFGSFYIKAGTVRYKFTFLIGKGRFYVAKD